MTRHRIGMQSTVFPIGECDNENGNKSEEGGALGRDRLSSETSRACAMRSSGCCVDPPPSEAGQSVMICSRGRRRKKKQKCAVDVGSGSCFLRYTAHTGQ